MAALQHGVLWRLLALEYTSLNEAEEALTGGAKSCTGCHRPCASPPEGKFRVCVLMARFVCTCARRGSGRAGAGPGGGARAGGRAVGSAGGARAAAGAQAAGGGRHAGRAAAAHGAPQPRMVLGGKPRIPDKESVLALLSLGAGSSGSDLFRAALHLHVKDLACRAAAASEEVAGVMRTSCAALSKARWRSSVARLGFMAQVGAALSRMPCRRATRSWRAKRRR